MTIEDRIFYLQVSLAIKAVMFILLFCYGIALLIRQGRKDKQ